MTHNHEKTPVKHIFVSMACKNLFIRKKRTFLTSFATAIGIAGVLLAFGIGFGVKERIMNEVGSIVNTQVVDVTETDVHMDEGNMEKILECEDVLNIYANNRPEVMCVYDGTVCEALACVIGPLEQPVPYWEDNLEYGNLPEENDSNEAVITHTMAETLVGEDGDIESLLNKELDMVFVASAENCVPKQVSRKIKIVGIAGSSFLGVEMVNIPYELAEEITRESLQEEGYSCSKYCVTVKSADAAADVKELLCEMGFDASLDEESLGTISSVINMVIAVIMLIAGIALIVAGIMIALVTYTGVVERTREIGILRALGFSGKNVLSIFLTEGGLIGFFAGAIGVLLSSGIGWLVNLVVDCLYEDLTVQLYQVNPIHILLCISFSVLIGIVCSSSPARKASKMEPVKALGYRF